MPIPQPARSPDRAWPKVRPNRSGHAMKGASYHLPPRPKQPQPRARSVAPPPGRPRGHGRSRPQSPPQTFNPHSLPERFPSTRAIESGRSAGFPPPVGLPPAAPDSPLFLMLPTRGGPRLRSAGEISEGGEEGGPRASVLPMQAIVKRKILKQDRDPAIVLGHGTPVDSQLHANATADLRQCAHLDLEVQP